MRPRPGMMCELQTSRTRTRCSETQRGSSSRDDGEIVRQVDVRTVWLRDHQQFGGFRPTYSSAGGGDLMTIGLKGTGGVAGM